MPHTLHWAQISDYSMLGIPYLSAMASLPGNLYAMTTVFQTAIVHLLKTFFSFPVSD